MFLRNFFFAIISLGLILPTSYSIAQSEPIDVVRNNYYIQNFHENIDNAEDVRRDIRNELSLSENEMEDFFDDLKYLIDDSENEVVRLYMPEISVYEQLIVIYSQFEDEIDDGVDDIKDRIDMADSDVVDTFKRLDDDIDDKLDHLLSIIRNLQSQEGGEISNGDREVQYAVDDLSQMEEDLEDYESTVANVDDENNLEDSVDYVGDKIWEIGRVIKRFNVFYNLQQKNRVLTAVNEAIHQAEDRLRELKAHHQDLTDANDQDIADLDPLDPDYDTNLESLNNIKQDLEDVEDDIEDIEDDIEDNIKIFENIAVQYVIGGESNTQIAALFLKAEKEIRDVEEDIRDDLSKEKYIESVDDLDEYFEDLEDALADLEENIRRALLNGYNLPSQNYLYNVDYLTKSVLNEIENAFVDNVISDVEKAFDDHEDKVFDDLQDINEIYSNEFLKEKDLSEEMKFVIKQMIAGTSDLKDIGSNVKSYTDVVDESRMEDYFEDIENEMVKVKEHVTHVLEATPFELNELHNVFSNFKNEVGDVIEEIREKIDLGIYDDYEDEKDDIEQYLETIEDYIYSIPYGGGNSYVMGGFSSLTVREFDMIIYEIRKDIEALEDIKENAKDEVVIVTRSDVSSYKREINSEFRDIFNRVATLDGRITADQKATLQNIVYSATSLGKSAFGKIENKADSLIEDFAEEEEEEVEEEAYALNALVSNLSLFVQGEAGSISCLEDVNSSVFKEYIRIMLNKGIVHGYSDCMFRAENLVTRAEFLKMALNSANKNVDYSKDVYFEDVSKSNGLYSYIAYAISNDLIDPVSTNKFEPNTTISRLDAVKVLLKIKNISPINIKKSRFSDVGTKFNKKYIDAAFDADILDGFPDGTFRPDVQVSRGQASKIIVRAFELK